MADLPGLIEGAHLGKGLGLQFLRHIERCRVIIHIIDLGESGRDPYNDYLVINEELKSYGYGLDKRPVILVASKMDEEGAKERLEILQSKIKEKIYPLSALLEEGVDDILYLAADILDKTPIFPLVDENEEELSHKVYTLEEEEDFVIRRLDAHTWSIEGDKLIKYYRMTNISTDEGMMKLMNHLRKLKVEDRLEELGAQDGDTVILDDYQFEYTR